jgi:co-chaperonin GroES (HSP10)
MTKKTLPKSEDIGIKVCGDRILVLVDEIEDEITTEFGLVIPQTGDDKKREIAGQNVGRLVKTGSLAWNDMPEPYAEVGDHVVYGKYAGTNIYDAWTDKTYKMLVDTDINAVLLDKP